MLRQLGVEAKNLDYMAFAAKREEFPQGRGGARLRDHILGGFRTDFSSHWYGLSPVVEVEYRQRLKDGLCHAVLKGLRPE